MNHLSMSIASVLIATIAATATAQDGTLVSIPVSSQHTDQTVRTWDTVAHGHPSEKFIVLTTAEPWVRHTCHVKSLSQTELLCAGKFGHTVAYRRDDIAALVIPGFHEHLGLLTFLFLSASAGAFAAACFVAPILLSIVGTLFFSVLGAISVGATGRDTPESLYYLRSGASLQIRLR